MMVMGREGRSIKTIHRQCKHGVDKRVGRKMFVKEKKEEKRGCSNVTNRKMKKRLVTERKQENIIN